MKQDNTEATWLRERGLSCYLEGDLEGATEHLRESSLLFGGSGHTREQGKTLSDLGAILIQRSQWDEAGLCLNQSLDLLTRAEDKRGQAQALGNLGTLHERCGDASSAEEHLLNAALLFGELGEDQLGEDTWKAISRLRLRQGRWMDAMLAYQEGLNCLSHPSLGKRLLRWFLRLPLYLLMR